MNFFRKLWVPLGAVVLLWVAYRNNGWAGIALVGGGIVMFLLLHFTRTMKVLKRAADRPIGSVASAVMLNAKLKAGMTLLHVTAMTRALGELRSDRDAQPELYRWTDAGGSFVDAEFADGRLRRWTLVRPDANETGEAAGAIGATEAAAPAPASPPGIR